VSTAPDAAIDAYAVQIAALERFQAKWRPVRVKKTRQIKNLEPRFDSIETERALGRQDPKHELTVSTLACVFTLALVLEQVRGNSRDPERCVAARFESLSCGRRDRGDAAQGLAIPTHLQSTSRSCKF